MVEIKIENKKLYINSEEITQDRVESIIDYYDIPGLDISLSAKDNKENLKQIHNFIHPDDGKWERGKHLIKI